MNVDLRKPSHVWFFAAFLPVASYGIGWEFVHLLPNLPFWVEGISPLSAYALLYNFFDKGAWHWNIFRWLKIVTVPDIRGRWVGEQTSSYIMENGKNATSHVIMEVTQTFSALKVDTYYKRWSSKISMAQFVDIEDAPTLLILFDAEPKVSYEHTLGAALKGTAKLVQMPDGTLQGTYFNAEGRHGELIYKRIGLKLNHTFDATSN